MTYNFKNVILRKPSKSVIYGISSKNLIPNFNKLLEEHNIYLNTLSKLGLKIHLLNSLESFPDSIFVEDPVIIYKSYCIILRPSHKSRKGEENIIHKEINHHFEKIFFIKNGFIEGGDILNIYNHFIIGLSKRTNITGAQHLSKILKYLGATVHICKTPKNILHFKSECSFIDEGTLLVSNRMAKLDYLKQNYSLIELDVGDENASNALRINKHLLISDGYERADQILSKKFNLIKININEISKIDAGLSCMSIRW